MQRRGEDSGWPRAAHAVWHQWKNQSVPDPATAAMHYQRLQEEEQQQSGVADVERDLEGASPTSPGEGRGKKLSVAEMKRELRNVTDRAEELEIKAKINQRSNHPDQVEARATLKKLQERRAELNEILKAADEGEKVVLPESPKKDKEPKKEKKVRPGLAIASSHHTSPRSTSTPTLLRP